MPLAQRGATVTYRLKRALLMNHAIMQPRRWCLILRGRMAPRIGGWLTNCGFPLESEISPKTQQWA
jgi:hypothetical protein